MTAPAQIISIIRGDKVSKSAKVYVFVNNDVQTRKCGIGSMAKINLSFSMYINDLKR